MLALAIAALFALAGLVAAVVIADSLLVARATWLRLMREGEVMRAGLAAQASARVMSLRPAPALAAGMATRRTMAARVPGPLRQRPLQACAAA